MGAKNMIQNAKHWMPQRRHQKKFISSLFVWKQNKGKKRFMVEKVMLIHTFYLKLFFYPSYQHFKNKQKKMISYKAIALILKSNDDKDTDRAKTNNCNLFLFNFVFRHFSLHEDKFVCLCSILNMIFLSLFSFV